MNGEIVATGSCARCNAEVGITEFTADIARHCNRVLRKRGEKPIGRSDAVICDGCYPAWQRELTERDDARRRAEKRARAAYRETQDRADIPPELRRDREFTAWCDRLDEYRLAHPRKSATVAFPVK